MRKKIKKVAHKVKGGVKKGIKKIKRKVCEAQNHKWGDEVTYNHKTNTYELNCKKCGATKTFKPGTKRALRKSFKAKV